MKSLALTHRASILTPWKRNLLGVLVCSGFLLGQGAQAVRADSITYKEQVTGSGSLGGTSFTNSLVTLVLTGEVSKILNEGSGLSFEFGAASVTVAGIGTGSFTDTMTMNAFSNQPVGAVGITDSGNDVLDTFSSAFAGYSLATSIGPISGASDFIPGHSFSTTDGAFILNGAGSSTFTASVVAPEPGVGEMLGTVLLGLMGLAFFRRRPA